MIDTCKLNQNSISMPCYKQEKKTELHHARQMGNKNING